MALVNQSDVANKLGRSLTTEEANAFTGVNAALQAFVEKKIGSKVDDVAETTRYYDGGVQHLKIDPCTDITSVAYVDDNQDNPSVIETSEYTKDPINSTVKIQLRSRTRFLTGIYNIAVTAKFSIYGDEPTRNIVKNALINAVASEIQNSGNIKRESIEGYSVEFAQTETLSALAPLDYLFPGV